MSNSFGKVSPVMSRLITRLSHDDSSVKEMAGILTDARTLLQSEMNSAEDLPYWRNSLATASVRLRSNKELRRLLDAERKFFAGISKEQEES